MGQQLPGRAGDPVLQQQRTCSSAARLDAQSGCLLPQLVLCLLLLCRRLLVKGWRTPVTGRQADVCSSSSSPLRCPAEPEPAPKDVYRILQSTKDLSKDLNGQEVGPHNPSSLAKQAKHFFASRGTAQVWTYWAPHERWYAATVSQVISADCFDQLPEQKLTERCWGLQIKVRTLEATLTYAETEEVEKNVSLKELVDARHLGFRAPALRLQLCLCARSSRCGRLNQGDEPEVGELLVRGRRLRSRLCYDAFQLLE